MADAVRCPGCGYVYWSRYYENWATCAKCGSDNDVFLKEGEDQPLLVSSGVIFQTIPYDLEKWGHLNPGVKKEKSKTKPKLFNRYTALTKVMETEKFTFFWSGTFSQWHPSPFQIEDIWFNCAEQHMMAGKALLFGDIKTLKKIMDAVEPIDQKRYGRQVINFVKERWDANAKSIVYNGNYAKFTQNEDLKKELLATAGTTLVEASPEDTVWGIGLRKDDPLAQNRATWHGTNWLGEVLTEVRDHLIQKGDVCITKKNL
jgi:hypothetical protein